MHENLNPSKIGYYMFYIYIHKLIEWSFIDEI